MSPLHPTKTMRRSALRRTSALASILALGFSGVTVLAGSPAQAADAAAPADVIMVQANIKTGMVLAKFQSDVREVLAPRPDFVTYNEVPLRKDGVLAPEGYDLFRTPGRYKGANPVVWRSDRWTPVATGTRRISNYREIPPKRHTMLGLRYANWVTLRSVDGRVASLVSAHVAPVVNGMPDLRRRTVKHIGALVTELKAHGPGVRGRRLQRALPQQRLPPRRARRATAWSRRTTRWAATSRRATTTGRRSTTSSTPRNDQIQAVDQRAVELNSDHDAVVAGLSWTVDAPADTTQVVNVPSGASVEQRLVVKHLLDGDPRDDRRPGRRRGDRAPGAEPGGCGPSRRRRSGACPSGWSRAACG